jgi:hypothetical protein
MHYLKIEPVIIIIRLMSSISLGPKEIALSDFHCISEMRIQALNYLVSSIAAYLQWKLLIVITLGQRETDNII